MKKETVDWPMLLAPMVGLVIGLAWVMAVGSL